MSTAEQKETAPAVVEQETSLLDSILDHTPALDEQERARNKSYIEEFVRNVVKPGQVISKDAEATIKYWIGEID